MESSLGPPLLGDQIQRGEASRWVRHTIEKESSILDSQRPKRGVSHVGPVRSSMKHHCSGNGHDSSNGSFCHIVGVVCTGANKMDDLPILFQVCRKVLRREC